MGFCIKLPWKIQLIAVNIGRADNSKCNVEEKDNAGVKNPDSQTISLNRYFKKRSFYNSHFIQGFLCMLKGWPFSK